MRYAAAAHRMTALLSIWAWVEVALVALVGFVLQTVLFIVCLPFDSRRAVAGRAFRLVGVVAARLNPFWRFGVVANWTPTLELCFNMNY